MPSIACVTKNEELAGTGRPTLGLCHHPWRTGRTFVAAVLFVSLTAAFGCSQRAETEQASRPDETTIQAATGQASQEQTVTKPDKPRETWDAVYLSDTKIGSVHTVFESIEQHSEKLVRITSVQRLEIKRDAQSAVMRTQIAATETPQGAIRSFTLETLVGPTPLTIQGTYQNKTLALVTTSHGKQMQSTMPWDDQRGGFFALEQSLNKQPMKPGEQRELTMLMPGVVGVQVITTSLQAESMETTELLDGPRQLLKIVMSNQIGNQQLGAICWTADSGDVLKMSIPSLKQTVYRTTRARAEAAGTGNYDLFRDSIVKVATPLPHPHQLTRAQYKVSLLDKDPSHVFAVSGAQSVQSIDSRQARVTVLAVRPGSPVAAIKDPAPEPDDSASSNLIQSDDPRIVSMARQLVGTATDPWAKCCALEKGVHDAIQAKNYGQGFATAADVAQTLEGDCTEHAVLLAALCRAQDIPARVALGLVYSRRDQGFAFHMWNEAWVRDRWIPLDATLGLGGIGAAHLKLTHSSLAHQAAESAILSVVQVINQLKIEVLDFQPAK